eukprot:286859-Rhodomonas_salina.3
MFRCVSSGQLRACAKAGSGKDLKSRVLFVSSLALHPLYMTITSVHVSTRRGGAAARGDRHLTWHTAVHLASRFLSSGAVPQATSVPDIT